LERITKSAVHTIIIVEIATKECGMAAIETSEHDYKIQIAISDTRTSREERTIECSEERRGMGKMTRDHRTDGPTIDTIGDKKCE